MLKTENRMRSECEMRNLRFSRIDNQRRHSEGASEAKNPLKFDGVKKSNLRKSKFKQIPFSALCFPFSVFTFS